MNNSRAIRSDGDLQGMAETLRYLLRSKKVDVEALLEIGDFFCTKNEFHNAIMAFSKVLGHTHQIKRPTSQRSSIQKFRSTQSINSRFKQCG